MNPTWKIENGDRTECTYYNMVSGLYPSLSLFGNKTLMHNPGSFNNWSIYLSLKVSIFSLKLEHILLHMAVSIK